MSSSTPNAIQTQLNLAITVTICATLSAILLGSYLGGKFLLRAWLFSSLSISLIIFAALGFHHVVVSHQNQRTNFPRRTFKPFTFSSPSKWPIAVRNLRAQSAF